jgi:hypothetical protein
VKRISTLLKIAVLAISLTAGFTFTTTALADAGGAPYIMSRTRTVDRYGCVWVTTYWSNADVVTSMSGCYGAY